MGAWGTAPFDSDSAADWAGDFGEADLTEGLRLIRSALEAAAATSSEDYLEADEGSLAVAAAELVTYIIGKPGVASPYNQTALTWVARVRPTADESIRSLARQALARVSADNSELRELWADSDYAEWTASLSDVERRLGADA